MSSSQSSYHQIVKATSIFGGVQIFNILISIIKSKFVAVLLGPTGMGIMGLLSSTIGLISGLTNFGLSTSAVRNVAEADGTGDKNRISLIITVLRRWVWLTGLFGMIVTIITAPLLSKITFGNYNYSILFIWVSVSLLFTQLSSGQMIVLQGLRKLQFLAKANLIGSILGLFFNIPLFYLFGTQGIVPAIIISSFSTFISSWFFFHKINLEKIKVNLRTTLSEGKNMFIMGFIISLSGLITLGVSYLIRIFISNQGGVEQVGLYNAGFVIINNYVGLIFTAMGTDYYPRLSAVAYSNELCKQFINEQAEIAVLIMAPFLMIFLVFINYIIIILYSKNFLAINEMIHWAALGMFFKAVSWAIAFVLLAKGESRLFFWNELLANVYILLFNIIGYKLFGLEGLGISFVFAYLFYLIQVFYISKLKYKFSFNKDFIYIFLFQFILAIICFIETNIIPKPYSYLIGCILIFISFGYSYIELDKRINIKSIGAFIRKKF